MVVISSSRSQDPALEAPSSRDNHSPTAVAATMSISSIGADADDEVKSPHHNILDHNAAGAPNSDQTDATASVVSNSDSSGGGDMAGNNMTSDQPSTNDGVETVLLTKSATGISRNNSDDHTHLATTLLCCVQDSYAEATMSEVAAPAAPVTSCQNSHDVVTTITEAANEMKAEASTQPTSWTESTRRNIEMGIESILSTVDSTGTRKKQIGAANASNDGQDMANTMMLSSAYEERYRSMVQTGFSNLEEKYEASTCTESQTADNNVNQVQEGSPSDSQTSQASREDETVVSPNPLTLARRNFSPLERSVRLRHMRREMSLSDQDEPSGGTFSSNVAPVGTSRTSSAPVQGSRSKNKVAQSFDDEHLRSQAQMRASVLNSTKQSGASKFNCISGGSSIDITGNSRSSASSSSAEGSLLAIYFQNACMCGDGGRLDPVDEENDILVSSSFIVGQAQFAGGDDNELLHGYDSDPELFHAASSSSSFGITVRDSKKVVSKDGQSAGTGKLPMHATRSIDLEDDKATAKLVQELVHDTMNLVLHPDASELAARTSSAPSSQRVWVELGSRIQGQIIQPKLVWRTANRKSTGKKGGAPNADDPTTTIDILDISRVRELSDAERKDGYPLAKRSCSFAIVTADHLTYVFEAKNAQEKDRITLGLKLLVARLASLIIVGDERLFADFFYPDSAADFHRTYE